MLKTNQLLKIKILSQGINISEIAKKELTQSGKYPLSLSEFPTTSGINLILPDNIWVCAHFTGNFKNSRITLDFIKSNFVIIENNKKAKVQISPLPSYITKRNKDGIPYKDLIVTFGDRMRINPIDGCSFRCKYCSFNLKKYQKRPIDWYKEAIDVALNDSKIKPKHMLLSGGTPYPQDRRYVDTVYKSLTQYLISRNIPTDIMLVPRPEKGFLKKLKSWGVDGLAINLEIYNQKIAKRANPQKAKITRKRYFEFIKEAVKIFRKGKVRSLLIVGLEPIKDTLKGVKEIAKLGCDPVLSPFVPFEGTPLENFKPTTEKDLIKVYTDAEKIVKKFGVKIGPRCVSCQNNTLTFPD